MAFKQKEEKKMIFTTKLVEEMTEKIHDGIILKRFEKVGSQEHVEDPVIIVKFFNPTGAGTWYATEYSPRNRMFFGYVSIYRDHCDEWGYFSLDELESYRGWGGLGIERDLHFGEKKFSEVVK